MVHKHVSRNIISLDSCCSVASTSLHIWLFLQFITPSKFCLSSYHLSPLTDITIFSPHLRTKLPGCATGFYSIAGLVLTILSSLRRCWPWSLTSRLPCLHSVMLYSALKADQDHEHTDYYNIIIRTLLQFKVTQFRFRQSHHSAYLSRRLPLAYQNFLRSLCSNSTQRYV